MCRIRERVHQAKGVQPRGRDADVCSPLLGAAGHNLRPGGTHGADTCIITQSQVFPGFQEGWKGGCLASSRGTGTLPRGAWVLATTARLEQEAMQAIVDAVECEAGGEQRSLICCGSHFGVLVRKSGISHIHLD